jgi:VIT1/CCC1 family predicted Fe2+/Mn2+ transporter
MIYALSTSLTLAVIILLASTWYGVVIQEKRFLRDFVEILLILFGTTVALYAFGYIVHGALPGIRVT